MKPEIIVKKIVSIDLDEIGTDDLLKELKKRKQMRAVDGFEEEVPEFDNMNDRMKYDFFLENYHKITLAQLEGLV